VNLNIVIFGLSITSSWGNGHATTYRALTRALERRGHIVTFLERDVPWYRDHRDMPDVPFCRTELYADLQDVPRRYRDLVSAADLVIVGSYVPDGVALAEWVAANATGITAFYDIDTPVTLARLERGDAEYITPALIPRFDLYLSFTGGPVLNFIENAYGSPRARALYCSVEPQTHGPTSGSPEWVLGYLGTYSPDRHQTLDRLLLQPARQLPDQRFAVAGAQYPSETAWPANVRHIEHVPPADHAAFYGNQRFTLNVTRAEMISAGFSPSVRLFEAAACGVPIISDRWAGLESFFTPGEEILTAESPEQVLSILSDLPDSRRTAIAAAARKRVLANHTADHRARELEDYYAEALEPRVRPGQKRARPRSAVVGAVA
jgi:spore maturation protein CgeB